MDRRRRRTLVHAVDTGCQRRRITIIHRHSDAHVYGAPLMSDNFIERYRSTDLDYSKVALGWPERNRPCIAHHANNIRSKCISIGPDNGGGSMIHLVLAATSIIIDSLVASFISLST